MEEKIALKDIKKYQLYLDIMEASKEAMKFVRMTELPTEKEILFVKNEEDEEEGEDLENANNEAANTSRRDLKDDSDTDKTEAYESDDDKDI